MMVSQNTIVTPVSLDTCVDANECLITGSCGYWFDSLV
jgi:hypothetical protein